MIARAPVLPIRSADELGIPGAVGRSPAMRDLAWQVQQVASKDVNVLVVGESGSGKELVARTIHTLSARGHSRFVALNCAAIPETLQDTELFGHERGSFTGAAARHRGRFEQAEGGTLFLDEVAELSPSVQSKLLRVLQERTVRRVGGGPDELPVDFRLIAASHRSLWREVQEGRFREDLYFRLVVYELEVPPLRDRTGDIPMLAASFVESFGSSLLGRVPRISSEAMEVLVAYEWPGNVRQLQNVIQRALIACSDGVILANDLPRSLLDTRRAQADEDPPADLDFGAGMTLAEVEHRAIECALRRAHGNVSVAARELGIARTTLYRKLRGATHVKPLSRARRRDESDRSF
jgi:two-component system, NtrC family, response regulator HydG